MLLTRLVFVPLLALSLVARLRSRWSWWNEAVPPEVQLVLLLEGAGPPAINLAIMAQLHGHRERETAALLFWTYAAASVTLAAWLGAHVWLVYP